MASTPCEGSGQPLPDDAREDFEADSTCTHFYCPECTKLLALPRTPAGTVRKHKRNDENQWPYANGVEPEPEAQPERTLQ